MVLVNGDIDPDPAYFDEYFLGEGFAAVLSVSQDAALHALGSFMLASLDSLGTLGSSPSLARGSSPALIPPPPPVADPQPAVGQAITHCNIICEGADFDTTDEVRTIQEGADFNATDFNTTDEVNFDQIANDEVTDYPQVVIIPSMQQHHLLSLLKQGLSMLTPNTPTSAFYKLKNYITDLCIVKLHYVWTSQ